MNCTEKNTVLFSAASYPHTGLFAVIGQFVKSARKFGYPIHFLNYKNNWTSFLDVKFKAVIDKLDYFQQQGIEYLVWCDAADTVCVKPFSDFIRQAQQVYPPQETLLTATDWNYPYSVGVANDEPAFQALGHKLSDGLSPGYCCMGLMVGHIDAYKAHYAALKLAHDRWRTDKVSFIQDLKVTHLSQLTAQALDRGCDQTLTNIVLMKNKMAAVPDIMCRLLANYVGQRLVTLPEMRVAKEQHLNIGEACILHGSPAFRLGNPLDNFINIL